MLLQDRTRERASLVNLPPELLHPILRMLSPPDWKALRQSCRAMTDIATHYLFRRIRMSLLKHDYSNLVGITSSAYLAGHVEQLIWYEIGVPSNGVLGDLRDWASLGMVTMNEEEYLNLCLRADFPKAVSIPTWEASIQRSGEGSLNGRAKFRKELDPLIKALSHLQVLVWRPSLLKSVS